MEWLTSLDWFALSCWFGAIVLIVLGFAGTIVPAIPGLPMIAAGGWLIGWADHYEKVGFWTIAVLIVLAVIGVVSILSRRRPVRSGQAPQRPALWVPSLGPWSESPWGFSASL